MPHLRFNPLLGTWTMVAANRQNRPHMPKDYCPFCPGSGQVPEEYDVFCYPNDFPTLQLPPQEMPTDIGAIKGMYEVAENAGICEVVLYSPDHEASLWELPIPHIQKLIRLWKERQTALAAQQEVKYVFMFENRGEEVGVTMPHPHGQIYAYPFIPQKLEVELENCRAFYEREGKNLLAEMNRAEMDFGKRLLMENDHFVAYIPFFTDYPYGVFIVSKRDLLYVNELNEEEELALAECLQRITAAFDRLFDRKFPYMMGMHQAPVNGEAAEELREYYRFHIEFYPPLRAADKIKWNASSETGAWAAANPRNVEETAAELRAVLNNI